MHNTDPVSDDQAVRSLLAGQGEVRHEHFGALLKAESSLRVQVQKAGMLPVEQWCATLAIVADQIPSS